MTSSSTTPRDTISNGLAPGDTSHVRTQRARARSTHHGAIFAFAVFGALLTVPALASEKTVRLPQGDVTILTNARPAQQKIPAGAAAHPFATARQRAAAKPLPWPARDTRSKATLDPSLPMPRPVRADAAVPGGAPPALAEDRARRDFGDAWRIVDELRGHDVEQAIGGDGDKDGDHQPYLRYPGNLYTFQWVSPPWNKIGKLYFTTPDGSGSYCTANVASGRGVIITAAHCVYTPGQGFNGNFVFVPAERFGVAPYGQYGWQSAAVLNQWISDGGRRWDVAVIQLAGESATDLPVTRYVGWLGRSWDWGYAQDTASHGYASNLGAPFTHICEGRTWSSPWEGEDVLVQGCDMTFGSSGGAWLRNYAPDSHAGNHVNAVVSGPHIGDFGYSYVGPRFSNRNIVPLCAAIGC